MMERTFAHLAFFVALVAGPHAVLAEQPWNRHTIDDGFRGADGVRLGDFDRDGLPDVVTGWEESGLVRLYLNPGHANAKTTWPAITVGKAKSPEDAAAIDVDGDGRLDVVSCHEGKQRQVLVHWNNAPDPQNDRDTLLDRQHWTTDRFAQLDGVMWMYALPLAAVQSRTAIVVGAKGPGASITLLLGPSDNARDLSSWTTMRLREAGWIMSLRAVDMDGDGDDDIVFTDRKGSRRVAAWLEQPDDPNDDWVEHEISGKGKEVMFLTATRRRCLIATRGNESLDCGRRENDWKVTSIANPDGATFGKAIEVLAEGRIVLTCNTAAGPVKDLPGIWLREQSGGWSPIDPTTRVKFDRMELLDLDGDGDEDVMTCEERRNLGVIWYENPGR